MNLRQIRIFFVLSITTILLSTLVLIPVRASAQRLFPTIAPSCDQTVVKTSDPITGFTKFETNKQCDFSDFVQLFINLFDWGLAILSILSIIFFIIGGTMLLMSAGKEQTVQKGKAILANTFLGIVVALGGWLIINTVIGLLVGNGSFQSVKVFGQNWWGVKSCTDQYKEACLRNNLHINCGDNQSTYVQELQRALNDAPGCSNFGKLSTDGCFGKQTEAVVKAFNEAQSIGGVTAIKETWDALAAGKGCTLSGSTTTLATGGSGCCITQCGNVGVEGTYDHHTTGATPDGCLDVYSDAAWYTGSCKQDATTTTGCCVLSSGSGCVENANKGWCSFSVPPKLPNGVYHPVSCSDASLSGQCGSSSIVRCNQ